MKKTPAKRVSVEEEDVFRNNPDLRKELRSLLASDIWLMANRILYKKRVLVERATESLALGSAEVISVRMNSQRVGIEGYLEGLHELTQPLPAQNDQDKPAVFGADQAAQRLAELGVSL